MEYPGRSVSVTPPIECSVLHGQDIIESVVANMLAGATLNSGAQTTREVCGGYYKKGIY